MPAPRVRGGEIVFSLDDPDLRLIRVRLAQEVVRARLGPAFRRRGTRWTLRFPRLEVDRIEYRLELTRRDGPTELVLDPDNPLHASGPFGEKSVAELPGYRPPAWLHTEPPEGTLDELDIRRGLGGVVWTSADADPAEPLPLLLVHDGPELAEFSALTDFLGAAVAAARLPPLRAALLRPPGDRDQSYSASAVYARTLVREILPALPVRPDRRPVVGMGCSLGALAAFHAHRLHPGIFGALFLQSGSFFRRRDDYESGFVRFGRITRFVEAVLAGRLGAEPIPVMLTCGTVEENLAGNRALRDSLASQGYPVELHEHRDAHNWIAWRDALDPHLVSLLANVWS